MTSDFTPVPLILTYNEEANIGRCLDQLSWAPLVLVVDSHSSDETQAICARYPNVRLLRRPFDNHANQWNFAVEQVPLSAEWILALDADYMLTDAFVAELARLKPSSEVAGYRCQFRYVVFGKTLRSGLYPPSIAVFRRSMCRYVQDGHTQRLVADGRLGAIVAPILHDDYKTLTRWIWAQSNYARLEAQRLIELSERKRLRFRDYLRAHTPFSPLLMAIYCLILRGGLFEGRAGWYYALQRVAAEALISAAVLEPELRERAPQRRPEREKAALSTQDSLSIS